MKAARKFALCIHNADYEASLTPRKIYEIIPDKRAEKDGFVRVIDESNEDYLYHANHFVFIKLPTSVIASAFREAIPAQVEEIASSERAPSSQ